MDVCDAECGSGGGAGGRRHSHGPRVCAAPEGISAEPTLNASFVLFPFLLQAKIFRFLSVPGHRR